MKHLHLSDDFSMPATAVTEKFALLAVSGAGKTNAARVMAEEFFAVGAPFVAIDPVGVWWGLRAGRDGAKGGIPIPVFGGKHGDVPLERTGGALIAELVVEQRLSCVLDMSQFDSEAAKKAFLLDFARTLFAKNTEPLHLFLEEADDYLPQKPMGDEKHLLRAMENIVRRGRARGLGITLITQRSAVVAKNVLTQVGNLITLRTTSPQDRKAIEAWIEYHGEKAEILASLPGLKDGEAWVWSPEFLRSTTRIRFRMSTTFDSGATPKLGKSGSKAAATLADVDLGQLQKRMAATIERAKADDPKALRAEIAALKKQLVAVPKAPLPPAPEVKRVEVPVLKDAQLARAEKLADRMESASSTMTEQARELRRLIALAGPLSRLPLPALNGHHHPRPPARALPSSSPRVGPVHQAARPAAQATDGDPGIGNSGMRRMLIALAQNPDGLTGRKLSILTSIARKGGTWRTYLGKLRSNAYVEGGDDCLRITEAGLGALGAFDELPTGDALRDHWRRELGESGMRRLFDVLVEEYPSAMEPAALAERAGIDIGGGTWRTYMGKLRSLELVTGKGELRAAEELFA